MTSRVERKTKGSVTTCKGLFFICGVGMRDVESEYSTYLSKVTVKHTEGIEVETSKCHGQQRLK